MHRQYSFQKLTQFSQGNNVLDSQSSNINEFLSRDNMFFYNSVE
jgi:hypothetical protein